MSPSLSPEIWLQVFEHSRNPLPKPHAEERCLSSAIRQPALCAILRVCRSWHNLAASILYRTAVIDSIPLFFSGLDNPAIPGITPKIELLALTTRLLIEDEDELSRSDRIEGGSSAPRPADPKAETASRGESGDAAERAALKQVLQAAETGVSGEPRVVLRGLRTVAVGSLCGKGGRRLRENTRYCWEQFIASHASTLTHYCESDQGPFSITEVKFPLLDSGYTNATFAFHYSDPRKGEAIPGYEDWDPIVLGNHTRWYLHYSPCKFLRSGMLAWSNLRHGVRLRLRVLLESEGQNRTAKDMRISGGVYLRDTEDPNYFQAGRDEDFKELFRNPLCWEKLPEWCRLEDNWEMKQLDSEGPPCLSCGWQRGG